MFCLNETNCVSLPEHCTGCQRASSRPDDVYLLCPCDVVHRSFVSPSWTTRRPVDVRSMFSSQTICWRLESTEVSFWCKERTTCYRPECFSVRSAKFPGRHRPPPFWFPFSSTTMKNTNHLVELDTSTTLLYYVKPRARIKVKQAFLQSSDTFKRR